MDALFALLGTLGNVLAVVIPIGLAIFIALLFRRVVEPNEVHVVNRRGRSDAYGRAPKIDEKTGKPPYEVQGNAYYEWPSWVPYFGVTKVVVPLNNFDLDLFNYEAYDDGKVPFQVDIKAFFRVSNPIVAAQRIHIHEKGHDALADLRKQLLGVLEGTSRSILAKHEVKFIMTERSQFGKMFTEETEDQLPEWGITNIKNIELMDVRDAKGSNTISNIMAIKESAIERESREQVAENKRRAQEAEIDAQRAVDVREQEAIQTVGERTAEQEKMVGIAEEHAKQEIATEQKETKERDMAVIKVNDVRRAEIDKGVAIVEAEQQKETFIIKAEGDREQDIIKADGELYAAQKEGEGIQAVGEGVAEAARLKEMARVSPELELVEGIGSNEGYQTYLVNLEGVKVRGQIGVAQAEALKAADIKVIVNGESANDGMESVIDLVSGKGGLKFGQFIEQFTNASEEGAALVERVTGKNGARPDGA